MQSVSRLVSRLAEVVVHLGQQHGVSFEELCCRANLTKETNYMTLDWLPDTGPRLATLLRWKHYKMGSAPDAFAAARPYGRNSFAVEDWLRQAADAGDCFSMERLGQMLLASSGTDQSVSEAFELLERAVELGSASAASVLGLWLLGSGDQTNLRRAKSLVIGAAERGHLPAAIELSVHLLTRTAMVDELSEGAYWLRWAAIGGDRLAMTLLGRYLIVGEYLAPSLSEGAEWLVLAGASKNTEIPNLGLYVYLRSINGTTATIRARFVLEAASLFLYGHLRGDPLGGAYLAYLIRRTEVPWETFPPLEELLREGLVQKRPFAIVNEALRRARGAQCTVDWTSADRLMQELSTTCGALDWWLRQAEIGDPEGHLVLGWMVRHGLTADPDGLEPRQRFATLIGTEWECPNWLSECECKE